MREEKPLYLAYLLRLWRDDETAPWRVSLEPPGNSERISLSSLEALFVFLSGQTGAPVQSAAEVSAGDHTERQVGTPGHDT